MGKEPEKEQLCPACGCHIGVDAYKRKPLFIAAVPALKAANASVAAVRKPSRQHH
jgi:hypothetical protein